MAIPRRDVDLGLRASDVPVDWCGDPFATTCLVALSLLFPEGERFFVDAVKQQRDRVTDPELLRAVVGFIGQEAMHGKEHRAFNTMLVEHGFTHAPLVDRRLRVFLGRVRDVLSPMSQLAATCALEHFTAMLAEGLLGDPRMQGEIHESVRPLWLWHALEESEHKAVAFDVYEAAGGTYARRVLVMMLTTAVFFTAQAFVHARMLKQRGVLGAPWRWSRGVMRLWIYPGYFARLAPAYLAYYRPGFHPDDRETRSLLETWRERLFGEAGTLNDRVRVIA